MKILIGQKYSLQNLEGQLFGKIEITMVKGEWIIGNFSESSSFKQIRNLFIELEKAANNQLLITADEISKRINELHLYICAEDGEKCMKAWDIQIMNQSDICFKNHR